MRAIRGTIRTSNEQVLLRECLYLHRGHRVLDQSSRAHAPSGPRGHLCLLRLIDANRKVLDKLITLKPETREPHTNEGLLEAGREVQKGAGPHPSLRSGTVHPELVQNGLRDMLQLGAG